MHIGTAMVHLCICQHPHQNPKYYKSSKPLHLSPDPFSHACDTLPQVFLCALVLDSKLLTFLKTQP